MTTLLCLTYLTVLHKTRNEEEFKTKVIWDETQERNAEADLWQRFNILNSVHHKNESQTWRDTEEEPWK